MAFKDAFEYHAEKIINQAKRKGFCTKSQLEYLTLYNEIQNFERPYYFDEEMAANTQILEDKFEESPADESVVTVSSDEELELEHNEASAGSEESTGVDGSVAEDGAETK